jgi:hypothetical protein
MRYLAFLEVLEPFIDDMPALADRLDFFSSKMERPHIMRA